MVQRQRKQWEIRASERQKERYAYRAAVGLCVHCPGKEAAPGRVQCMECLEKARRASRKPTKPVSDQPFDPEICMLIYAGGGYSMRELMRLYGVSLRQVQKAIDPAKRREQDRRQQERFRALASDWTR